MTLRPPSGYSGSSGGSLAEAMFDALGHEVLAEKAAALGRAGERAEKALLRLKDYTGDEAGRAKFLKETAGFVYAWFIQRELCGFRRHDAVILDLQIPREVLVRLGAA
ncbi:MAG TPA: DUF6665 family protein [Mesorhizobium sp.]|jgi:hypothetical protein|uniref:DUF6665 family protein n=1 Tax=Mesorhizobium sp. TaxID=1871066 RepID=UPI002DDD112F|nr:DUF6665 family protein [Mesorhizobium sp.]HEV2505666.1 DUF6665 family protein [Mesorhizobium sp.]